MATQRKTNTTGRRRNQSAIDALNAAAIAAGAVADAAATLVDENAAPDNDTTTTDQPVTVATLDRMPLKTAMATLGFAHIDGKQIRRVLRKYYATDRGRTRVHGNGGYRDNWTFAPSEFTAIGALITKHIRGAKPVFNTPA